MIFDGGREDWEPAEVHDHRVGSVIAAVLSFLALCVVAAYAGPAIPETTPIIWTNTTNANKITGLAVYAEGPGAPHPSLTIPKGQTFVADVGGEQTDPLHAVIEVEGSGNHCLLEYNGECIIKGDHLEIR